MRCALIANHTNTNGTKEATMHAARRRSARPSPLRQRLRLAGLAGLALGFSLGAAPGLGQSPHPFGKPAGDVEFPSGNVDPVRATRPVGWKDQTRSEVLARNGIVATSEPAATAVGLQVLHEGGNAMDAAVAASAALAVVEPQSTGLGGDLFALVWSARHQKLFALMSSGWSPAGWTPEYFRNLGVTSIPQGINSAVVPGAVSGWFALNERFGTKSMHDLLAPAEKLAREGWPVHEVVAGSFRTSWEDPDSAEVYLPDGKRPPLYSILRNPGMARAFRLLQTQGRDAFYKGPIARAIVEKSIRVGGQIRMPDLEEYQSEWVEPLRTNYHGYDIYQLPPPTQGFATLSMLNILEVCAPKLGVNLTELGPRDPLRWHLLIEAKKLAYSDLIRYNADPKVSPVPINRLLSKKYVENRLCEKLSLDRARPAEVTGNLGPGTIYMATADRWGNMVSLVFSVFSSFGSRVTIPPYGFQLANRGQGFTLEEGHPNQVGPRKRPFITIIAGFIMKDDRPLMAFGNMGGGTQPQAHAQHVVNMVDHGMNVQMTSDAARFDHSQTSDQTALDEYLYELIGPALMAKGHRVTSANGHAGGYQGVYFERDPKLNPPGFGNHNRPVNGVYRAGSDSRKDGHAAGW
jgi:gamma-glutamyltranspeptidase/glutathione hydrolase